jgi:hypothetical protein
MASYADVFSESAIHLWVAPVAVDWLGKWTFTGCMKKLLRLRLSIPLC